MSQERCKQLSTIVKLRILHGVSEEIIFDIARHNQKTLVFVDSPGHGRKVERILATVYDRDIPVVNAIGSCNFGADLDRFAKSKSGMLLVPYQRSLCTGWFVRADATVFVDARVDIDSNEYLQFIYRNRTLPDPLFVNCMVHSTVSCQILLNSRHCRSTCSL
jgi:hypothetical protein